MRLTPPTVRGLVREPLVNVKSKNRDRAVTHGR